MAENTHNAKNRLGLALSLITLISCLGIGVYSYSSSSSIEQRIQAQLSSQLEAQRTDLTAISAQIEALTEQTQQQQTQTDHLNQLTLDQAKALNNLKSTFDSLYPSHLVEWQVKQIEFYLWLAHKRLALTEDLIGTSVLIEQAIDIATQIKDPNIDGLVQTLQNDRAQLKIESLQDQDTLITRIKALEPIILEFDPKASTQNTLETQTQQDSPSTPQAPITTEGQLSKAIKHLSNALFRVTDLTDPVRPMAAIEMQKLSMQQATLYLNQAKLYLLNRNYTAFFQSIAACKQLIELHFSTHTKQVQFVIQELNALSSLELATSLPRLDASFDAFKQYVALRSKKALALTQPGSTQ